MRFDEAWAQHAVDQLKVKGVQFDDESVDAVLDDLADMLAIEVPPELRLFLRAGVPATPPWTAWRDGAAAVLERTREWIDGAFRFDIERNGYWHPLLGERPGDSPAAVEQALAIVGKAPPLIPVYAHRFLTTQPVNGSRAVLSVYQAVDSIYYGYDFADYLAREFGIDRPSWAAATPPRVPIWEDLFSL